MLFSNLKRVDIDKAINILVVCLHGGTKILVASLPVPPFGVDPVFASVQIKTSFALSSMDKMLQLTIIKDSSACFG